MSCENLEPLLAARMAGDITPEELELIDVHLRECRDCAYLAGRLELPAVADALASAARDERDFAELAVVDGDNYVRGKEIGRGGMGRIVRARDRRLGRAVAIKELIDERMAPRFEREARLTARLQHPAIVSVHEAGRWPSGEPFYAMKYVAGRRLDVVVADAKSLRERLDLLPNFLIVVEAIAYAHAEGVIHRDVKPQNILIGPFGETVVIDWGLAKEMGSDDGDELEPYRALDTDLTAAGAGTPAYMAPEQARGETPDARVDVYSLGATLAHLLGGRVPDGKPLTDEVPVELRAIAAKATARDPDARYGSASELASELRLYQSGQLVGAHRYGLGELIGRFLRKHRAVVTLSAVFLLALTGLGVVSVRQVIASAEEARRQRDEAERALAMSLAERGRVELVGGEPSRAMPYLVAALQRGLDTPELRLMLGMAEKATSGLVMSIDGANGAAALDPAGKRLAVSGPGNAVRIVDVPSGTLLLTLAGHRAPVAFIAWSADGNQLATAASAGDTKIRVWNAGDGSLVKALEGGDPVASLHFGSKLVATAGSHAVVWDGTNVVFIDAQTSLHEAALDAEGRRVVTAGSDGIAVVWDAASGARLAALEKHDSSLQGAAFSPDGTRVVTAGWDHRACVWDPSSGERLSTLDIGSGSVYEASFSPDGVRVLVRGPDTVSIFLADGKKIGDLEVGFRPTSAVWAGSDEVVVAGGDGSVRIFDDRTELLARRDGHLGAAWGLSVARGDTLIASTGRDGTAKVWAARPDGMSAPLPSGSIQGRFDDRGHLFATTWTVGPSMWDVVTGQLESVFHEPSVDLPWATWPCRLADGTLVFLSNDGEVWDPVTDERRGPTASFQCIDAADKGISVFRAPANGHRRDSMSDEPLSPATVPHLKEGMLSRDWRLFAGVSEDATEVEIFDVTSGVLVSHFDAPPLVTGLRFAGDRLVVIGGFGDPELHDIATGRLIGLFAGHRGGVLAAMVSGDGRYLVTAGQDGAVRLFLVATRDPLVVLPRSWQRESVALDEHGEHAFAKGRIQTLSSDGRAVDEIADSLALVPYALENGRLVTKRPMARVSRTLPPARLPAAARPSCPAGTIPRGAVFPFGRMAFCVDGHEVHVGTETVWWPSGAPATVIAYGPRPAGPELVRSPPRHELLMDRQGRKRFELEDNGSSQTVRAFDEQGRRVRERIYPFMVGPAEVRTWHPNGALAEHGHIPACISLRDCLVGRETWETFHDDGTRQSAGTKMFRWPGRYRPVEVWRFWTRTGVETTFDFGK